MTTIHAQRTGGNDVHGPFVASFANAAARVADTGPYTAAQSVAGGSENPVLALQEDTGGTYYLANHDPVTWTATFDVRGRAFSAYVLIPTTITVGTTAVTIPFDTTSVSDTGYTLNGIPNHDVTIADAGTYLISWSCSYIMTTGSGGGSRSTVQTTLELDPGGGFALVAGSIVSTYMRQDTTGDEGSGAGQVILSLDASDVLRVRAISDNASTVITSLANGQRLNIVRLN